MWEAINSTNHIWGIQDGIDKPFYKSSQVIPKTRDADIRDDSGNLIFELKDVKSPEGWSDNAINIVASKYFARENKETGQTQEDSVFTMVNRVVNQISSWGREDSYFNGLVEEDSFYHNLRDILLNQYATFNSPVWFNVGVEEHPQCSACFINSVEDTMESIMDLARREALLFKWGSGTGTNISTLRSSKEHVAGGGLASGPVSFMRGYDSFAGVIKSGGKTRRAAKMLVLEYDHPDVKEFIWSKANEEFKALALIKSGFSGGISGEAYGTVAFQNANHSVRVSNSFYGFTY